MVTLFMDCCIRYGQEFLYTRFSEGNMTLGEIYMSLAYGLIDPPCLPSMAIIHYDNKTWCTDTRRLTLAKELERHGRFDILEQMHVKEVKRNTPQYTDFVHHRLPAMQRKGFDGLTIKLSDRRGPICCFNSENRFRVDLEEHIIQDHLIGFTLDLMKSLTVYYCNRCQTKTRITCIKSINRSFYSIIRRCGCMPKKSHQFAQPWSELTFVELCNEFLRYNHLAKRNIIAPKQITHVNNTGIIHRSIATQTNVIDEPSKSIPDLQNTSKPIENDYSHNQSNLQLLITSHQSKRMETNIPTCQSPFHISPIPNLNTSINSVSISRNNTKHSIPTLMRKIDSAKQVHRHNENQRFTCFHHPRQKFCCIIT